MADNSLRENDLQGQVVPDDSQASDRRAFVKKAAIVTPLVLATVLGRTPWASAATASCLPSMRASGWCD
jgi:hypothetical protein